MHARRREEMGEAREVLVLTHAGVSRQLAAQPPPGTTEQGAGEVGLDAVTSALEPEVCTAGGGKQVGPVEPELGRNGRAAARQKAVVAHVHEPEVHGGPGLRCERAGRGGGTGDDGRDRPRDGAGGATHLHTPGIMRSWSLARYARGLAQGGVDSYGRCRRGWSAERDVPFDRAAKVRDLVVPCRRGESDHG